MRNSLDAENETTHETFVDLHPLAIQAMAEEGFTTKPPPEVVRETAVINERVVLSSQSSGNSDVRDLRALLWSSIDNPESRDLDQIEFARQEDNGAVRLMVGIADVDAFVPKDSATDRYAHHNTTSVYTGIQTFPMLPPRLSEDASSLLADTDHLAVVTDLLIGPDGVIQSSDIYRALVRNRAKLSYEAVGDWLADGNWLADGKSPLPETESIPGLAEQLRLQEEISQRLLKLRQKHGALDLETIEASPIVVDGTVMDLRVNAKNRARYLIENFMVAANNAVAEQLLGRGITSIQRVVRTPDRWNRIAELAAGLGETLPATPSSLALSQFLAHRQAVDPLHFPDLSLSVVKLLGPGEYTVIHKGAVEEGHFGLAVQGYTHSTAPNRRYPDLVTQRLLKAMTASAPTPYSAEELTEIAAHCNERASAARKVERRMRKAAAAVLLKRRIGDVFDALVTGASEKGTYVRLLSPPAEGRVLRGERGLDVGDRVRVRLLAANPYNGFIDFQAMP